MSKTIKPYSFEDFDHWVRVVHESIDDFAEQFGVHPNIMCASPRVWRSVDGAVQHDLESVVNENEDSFISAVRYAV